MNIKILVAHWTATLPQANVGDYAIVPLLKGLVPGCEIEILPEYSQTLPDGYDFALVGIGSVLSRGFWERLKQVPVKYWGSGVPVLGEPWALPAGHEILAVRGEISRADKNLPDNFPTGDPLFLLCEAYPDLAPDGVGVSLYVPHLRSRLQDDQARMDKLAAMGVEGYSDTMLDDRENDFWPRIQEWLNAPFIVTGSLHCFILRVLFGLPVALGFPPGVKVSNEVKWLDTFSYLGIDGTLEENTVNTLAEGQAWWTAKGQNVQLPDTEELQAALPFPLG